MVTATSHNRRLQTRFQRFLTRPQRHRLLHGYPLAAAMPYADEEARRQYSADAPLVRDEPLLVGVLPHPFCNPKVSGCGFCTFPHETFHAATSRLVTEAVVQELRRRVQLQPSLGGASVAGLYFGGGTANLTPPDSFRSLARGLAETLDLTEAEVSLEGVPGRFLHGKPLLMDVIREELPACHFRISMGLQTFSVERLEQMGRLGFGRPETFGRVVAAAHQREMTVSGDLLMNLPGQSLAEMEADVEQAVDIGLDQICLYHLVMFRGLGTPWSQDERLLAALPDNQQACDHWLQLRQRLLACGYRQTSLTNFERRELADDPRRYQYEPISYESDCRVLGFGPSGISCHAPPNGRTALKTMNPESSAEYLQSTATGGATWNRFFAYSTRDLEVLHLTRRLASLRVSKPEFAARFGGDAWDRYRGRLELLTDEGLMAERDDAFRLTPRGMFFSDAAAGLLAETRWEEEPHDLPPAQLQNDNSYGHM